MMLHYTQHVWVESCFPAAQSGFVIILPGYQHYLLQQGKDNEPKKKKTPWLDDLTQCNHFFCFEPSEKEKK